MPTQSPISRAAVWFCFSIRCTGRSSKGQTTWQTLVLGALSALLCSEIVLIFNLMSEIHRMPGHPEGDGLVRQPKAAPHGSQPFLLFP